MKRFLVLLLAAVMVFCFAACDSGSDDTSSTATSSKPATSSQAASSEATSSEEASSEETSSEATSSDESSATSSGDVSSGTESGTESGGEGEEVAEFISQFFSWEGSIGNGGTVNVKAGGAKSVRLTGLNVGAVDGVAAVLGFNSDYADSAIYSEDGSYDNYEVFVFEYNHDVWGYELTASYDLEAEDKDDVEIPEDGYVVAVHSYFADYITAIKSAEEGSVFTPYGFRGTNDIDATISSGTATIDGDVSEDEYGDPVWILDPDSSYASFEQFDVNVPEEGYYSTADVYMMYDAEYLYLAVIVDSPYHYNTRDSSNAGEMYNQECIQVNICSVDPKGEYIANNWDTHEQHAGVATSANIVRQYGFCVNETGDTLSCVWIGSPTTSTANAIVTRDDENQLTIYEVAIPLSECGATDATIVGEEGTVIGVSLSINSGREDKPFMNYYLRDGGGVIGRNDWSKIPQITFE